NGTLTITKVQLVVNADNQSKTYGQSDPSATYGLSGFKLGQTEAGLRSASTLSGSPSCVYASHSENAGTYVDVITCSPSSLLATNYTFATGNLGDLVINTKLLTVTADSTNRPYGDGNP